MILEPRKWCNEPPEIQSSLKQIAKGVSKRGGQLNKIFLVSDYPIKNVKKNRLDVRRSPICGSWGHKENL